MRIAQPRPDYDKLVDRILSGELTRLQAADISFEQTGLKPQTFLSWLRSSGNLEKLKETRGNTGANSQFAHTDPDKIKAYDDAMALALSGKVSARASAARFGVNYQYLLRKINKLDGVKEMKASEKTAARLEQAITTP